MLDLVVIYLKFTSNHNLSRENVVKVIVVIYLKFTSNHNVHDDTELSGLL